MIFYFSQHPLHKFLLSCNIKLETLKFEAPVAMDDSDENDEENFGKCCLPRRLRN